MAEPAKPGGTKSGDAVDTSTHPLVKKLLGDADPPRDIGTLTGYFGPSKKPGHVRLYHALDFRDYAEIPTGRILHTAPVTPGDENCPTKVFIDRAASIELVQIDSTSVAASFLQGGIAQAHLPPTGPVGAHHDVKTAAHFGPLHEGGFPKQTPPVHTWTQFTTGLDLFAVSRTPRPCC